MWWMVTANLVYPDASLLLRQFLKAEYNTVFNYIVELYVFFSGNLSVSSFPFSKDLSFPEALQHFSATPLRMVVIVRLICTCSCYLLKRGPYFRPGPPPPRDTFFRLSKLIILIFWARLFSYLLRKPLFQKIVLVYVIAPDYFIGGGALHRVEVTLDFCKEMLLAHLILFLSLSFQSFGF